jgi:trigger factor
MEDASGNGVKGEDKKPPEMSVTVERLGDVERKLEVEIPWQEVKDRLDEAYRELKTGVTLKGFRKGKVPRRMLEQLFGKHVVKEVAQRLVQESIAKAMIDSELTPVSEPQVEDGGIEDGESFKYSAVVQVVPDCDPQDYFGVEVKVREAQVSDEAVELALSAKQRELTAFQSIEGRVSQDGDVLVVDVMGKIGDETVDVERELVELGDPPREPVPGLATKLTGLSPETDELELELDVPSDEEGKPPRRARLLVTIHEMRQKIVPELDDDFAKDTGEAETLDELKELLRRKLLEEDGERAQREARDTLLDAVAAKNDLPTVPALVDRNVDRRLELQKMLMGLSPETTGLDEESLKEHLRDDAADAVKKALLLSAIAKKEKVEVQEADVEKKLAEIASARGQNVARVRSEYEKEGMMASLRERILEDKTLDLLMSKANIITKENESPGAEEVAPPPPEANESEQVAQNETRSET